MYWSVAANVRGSARPLCLAFVFRIIDYLHHASSNREEQFLHVIELEDHTRRGTLPRRRRTLGVGSIVVRRFADSFLSTGLRRPTCITIAYSFFSSSETPQDAT